jgi:M6 family metalloprotease-like protein
LALYAVPAKRGWQTYTQADGTTIEVQLLGDEFYHYTINREGQEVRLNDAGNYEVVGAEPTPERVKARRMERQARRMRQGVGVSPNLAPRGVVVLINFSDTEMKADHTREVFDELCNSENCTVNAHGGQHYPSAAEYFKAQSHGLYRPTFDVFGPVTLSKECSFYGQNDEDGNDMYPTDAVIEACILAKQQYPELNFANYDSDNDGYVDFVYAIYAGKGEADGGAKTTIWPHNWEIVSNVTPLTCNNRGECWEDPNGERPSCCYTEDDIVIDGKILNNYAMSSELSGNALNGIGTLCHEFGHVLGLPDFYDTNYGTNYEQDLTPNQWNIMDAGSYNGNGHCPPNYDPWEKYFMGWLQPENLGDVGRNLTLVANGREGYTAYQINASGKQVSATTKGLAYYIENRQQEGWDEFLPAPGMVIWKVDFDEDAWINNTLNNTANKPRYTLVIPEGTKIGSKYSTKNVWPYGSKTSWEGVSGKPLLNIARQGEQITLVYIEELTSYPVRWYVNGELLEEKEYNVDGSEDLVLPATPFDACEGTTFIGWTKQAEWCDPFDVPEDLELAPSGKVTRPVSYYALFE